MLPANGDRDRATGAEPKATGRAEPAGGSDAERLRAFRDRLNRARGARDGRLDHRGVDPPMPAKADGALSMGFRIGMEFVSAVVVGVLIGWVIDRAAGTSPWGLVSLFLLGSAAGFLNVYRATLRMGMMGRSTETRWPGVVDRKPVDQPPVDAAPPDRSAPDRSAPDWSAPDRSAPDRSANDRDPRAQGIGGHVGSSPPRRHDRG